MYDPKPQPSRTARRSGANRAQRTHSFSRSWRRQLSTALLMGLLPLGLSNAAHAQTYTLNAGSNHVSYSLGSDIPGNGGSYGFLQGTSGTTDILDATSLVHGPYGYIGDGGATKIINQGIIQSDVKGGAIFLRNSPFGNTGAIKALNGGTLYLASDLDNTGGILIADAASAFNIGGVTVTGGQSTGAGAYNLSGTTLSGFTANSGLSVANATIINGLTLNGTATVSGDLYLTDSAVTTTGAGDIKLGTSTPGNGNGYAILHSNGSTGNTIGAGVTVHGPNGYIGDGGALFTNSGLISSDVSGGILHLRSTTFNNSTTIQAINGGTISLEANLTNTGAGKFIADAASAFNIGGVTVTGGQSTGAGAYNLSGTTLSGFTANSGLSVANATIINGLTLNGTATVSGDLYLTDSAVTTTGAGDIKLGTSTPGNGNGYAILHSNGSTGNTIGAGVTVHGPNGYIGDGGALFTNSGLISSDVSGGQLDLRSTAFANKATVQAVGGGTINLDANLTNTGAGKFVADAASAFNIGGVTVTGGQSTGAGAYNLNGTTLSGFTANSGLSVATATVVNGLTLNGAATVSNNLSLTDSAVSGTGSVSLGTSTPGNGNGYAILYSNGTTGNTIGSGVTVHGPNGYIGDGGALFTNSGLISSDVSGGQLDLRSTAFANKATVQAVGGGTINLDANLTNTGAGKFVADAASAFNIGGVTVTGGQSTGAGAYNLNGTTLSGFTANSGLSVATATVVNGLTLNGAATVSNNLSLTDSAVSGTGSVSLGTSTPGNGNGYAILYSNGTTGNTIGTGVTVHGPDGYIGDGGTALTNRGVISSDVSGGQLTLRNTSVANQGTAQAVNGGTLNVTTPFTDTGTVKAGAGSAVNFDRDLTQSGTSSQTIADGTISINSGNGTLTVTAGTLKGAGTVSGNVVATGGDVAPGDSPGTLAVGGNYTQTGGALDIEYTASLTQPIAHDLLTVSGTATLGGVLNISFLGPSVNGVYLATAGERGTTFDFLTFGTLGNTNGLAGLFTNEYNVGSNYFVNGISSNSVAGVPAQYRLTFDPNNNKALQLSLTTAAAPEPSQWAAFGLGILGLAGLGGRARRKVARSR